MKTYEEQKSFVAKLNVIDDVFFHKMAEDKEILRILLSKPNLKVRDWNHRREWNS